MRWTCILVVLFFNLNAISEVKSNKTKISQACKRELLTFCPQKKIFCIKNNIKRLEKKCAISIWKSLKSAVQKKQLKAKSRLKNKSKIKRAAKPSLLHVSKTHPVLYFVVKFLFLMFFIAAYIIAARSKKYHMSMRYAIIVCLTVYAIPHIIYLLDDFVGRTITKYRLFEFIGLGMIRHKTKRVWLAIKFSIYVKFLVLIPISVVLVYLFYIGFVPDQAMQFITIVDTSKL